MYDSCLSYCGLIFSIYLNFFKNQARRCVRVSNIIFNVNAYKELYINIYMVQACIRYRYILAHVS